MQSAYLEFLRRKMGFVVEVSIKIVLSLVTDYNSYLRKTFYFKNGFGLFSPKALCGAGGASFLLIVCNFSYFKSFSN